MILRPCLLRRRHRLEYRVRNLFHAISDALTTTETQATCLLRVPRVDDNAPIQALRRARELGEDHHALARLLARDVFVRDLARRP